MSNQEKRQQSIRAVTGTAYHYEGDWHALFDLGGIASGFFNDRLKAWINTQLGTSYQFLSDAQKAYAVSQGFTSWAEMGTFSPYDADAVTYFNAMSTQEPAAVKTLLNTFIRGLKSDSLWTLIDGGNILALGTSQAARVDFKAPSRVATLPGSPTHTFTAYRGFTGSAQAAGSQTDYIDTGFIPSTAGGVFTQNSAHIGIWCNSNTAQSVQDFGANGTNDAYLFARNAAGNISASLNNGTNNGYASGITDSIGFTLITRTAAAVSNAYKNGVAVGSTVTTASAGLPNVSLRYLQIQSLGSSNKQISAGVYGAGLNATQAAALYARFNTLISALTVL